MNTKQISIQNLFLLALSFLLTTNAVFSQKSIEDLATFKDSKWNKIVKSHKSGLNTIPAVEGLLDIEVLEKENLPNPKNVGVLTFQLWDESITKSTKAGNWTYYKKYFITPSGSNSISNKLIGIMLPQIKDEFNKSGVELFEPNEFIKSDEQRKIYNEGKDKIELSGILKVFAGGFLDKLQGNRVGQGSLSADGYEFYPITASLIASDFKSPAAIGLVTEELGLDSSLIISVNVSIEKGGKALMFRGMEFALIGPIADDESIEYKGKIGAKTMNYYREGVVYSTAYFEVEDIMIGKMDKKTGNIEEWYLDGFDMLTRRLAEDLVFGLEKFKKLDTSKK